MTYKADWSTWKREFLRRFESVRASLRGLQLEVERENATSKASTAKRLDFYFQVVDDAFEVMNRSKPVRESTDDKAARQGLSLARELEQRE